jgi:hypothetical protein
MDWQKDGTFSGASSRSADMMYFSFAHVSAIFNHYLLFFNKQLCKKPFILQKEGYNKV